jgi:hypothetical protein
MVSAGGAAAKASPGGVEDRERVRLILTQIAVSFRTSLAKWRAEEAVERGARKLPKQ